MIIENIYDGKKSNNKINKRKYRKHSMSPFCGLAPNVEKNIEMFNKANDTGSVPTSGAGMNGNSGGEGMGESLLIVEDIASTQKQYSYIPENDFFEIIALDPTYNPDRDSVGKYGKWLLGLYKKDNPLNHENTEIYNLLTQYDKYKNDRKYQIEKDINKFKSFDDLSNALDNVDDAELSSRQKERELRTSNDYKVVYKDDDWTIYVPLSYAGSCTLGKGTKWCTAYSDDDRYYYDYIVDGPLYIVINNDDKSEKYQFHFPSDSYMDADDEDIDIDDFFKQFPNVAEFFGISTHIVYSGGKVAAKTRKYIVSVDVRGGTNEINASAFSKCTSLKSIKIPSSVAYIGDEAFFGCTSLQSIIIPNSVIRIGSGAFEFCESLESITIPNSVTGIGVYAFYGCTSLKTLVTTKNSYAENYFKKNYPNVNIKYLNTNESLNETAKPTYTYSYIGPVYRFENIYTVLKEPVYTTAQNRKQAATMLKGKLKQEFGFDFKAKLDIDEENIRELSPIELEDEQDYYSYRNNKLDNHDEDDMVGYINGKPIYFEDGYYTIGGIGGTFISFEEAKEYLED